MSPRDEFNKRMYKVVQDGRRTMDLLEYSFDVDVHEATISWLDAIWREVFE